MKRATRCPGCGEPVSVFAAGCAICGTDLEQHRREIDQRGIDLPHVPRARRASVGFDGQIGQRSLFIVLVVVNLALTFVPALRFGLYSLLS